MGFVGGEIRSKEQLQLLGVAIVNWDECVRSRSTQNMNQTLAFLLIFHHSKRKIKTICPNLFLLSSKGYPISMVSSIMSDSLLDHQYIMLEFLVLVQHTLQIKIFFFLFFLLDRYNSLEVCFNSQYIIDSISELGALNVGDNTTTRSSRIGARKLTCIWYPSQYDNPKKLLADFG